MDTRPIRVYADTSVFGGVFDDEFAKPSRRFFDLVRLGRFVLVCSTTLVDEVLDGPPNVRALYEEMSPRIDVVVVTEAAYELQALYLTHAVVTEKWATDALHVAVSTVEGCAAIVSWNFRHIVNHRRIPLYNAVNRAAGYHDIAIYSPLELIEDGDAEEDV